MVLQRPSATTSRRGSRAGRSRSPPPRSTRRTQRSTIALLAALQAARSNNLCAAARLTTPETSARQRERAPAAAAPGAPGPALLELLPWHGDNHGRQAVGNVGRTTGSGRPAGARASANTSGPDFAQAESSSEIADRLGNPHRTKKTRFFCRIGNNDPAVDLMSRRHPLSSLRATGSHPPSQEANRPISPTTRRLQSAGDLE
jgi:hypothetical protein